MRTKTGKRSAEFGVQIVEDPGGDILMFFEGHDLPPIEFYAKSGRSGPKAHRKLKSILDKEEQEA